MLRISLVSLVLAAACGDGTGATPPPDMAPSCTPNGLPPAAAGDLVVTGAVAATAGCAPEAGRVYGIWSGQGPKDEYIFQYGEGTATRAGFSLGLAAAIPREATYGDAFGVGVIALVDAATPIPPGIVDIAAFERDLRGQTGLFAVVYRGPNAGGPEWVAGFPAGLSCGKCVKAKAGDVFDTFAPIACSEVVLDVGDEDALDICNWI